MFPTLQMLFCLNCYLHGVVTIWALVVSTPVMIHESKYSDPLQSYLILYMFGALSLTFAFLLLYCVINIVVVLIKLICNYDIPEKILNVFKIMVFYPNQSAIMRQNPRICSFFFVNLQLIFITTFAHNHGSTSPLSKQPVRR